MNLLSSLAWAKARLWAIGAFLLTILALLLRGSYFKAKAKNATSRQRFAEAQLHQRVVTDKADQEIEERIESMKEDGDEMPAHIRNRNNF